MDVVDLARRLAPEVDDLVFSVHRKARHEFAEPLIQAEEEAGIVVRGRLGNLTDLILCDRLDEKAALLRGRYHPPEAVRADLEDLETRGALEPRAGLLVASPTLLRLARLAENARGDAAASLWSEDEAELAAAPIPQILAASPFADGLLAGQLVAPEHDRPAHRLFQRLTRLRYLRNDAHAAAWSGHGLAAQDMVQLTAAWNDTTAPEDVATRNSLVERGLLDGRGRLTAEGTRIREAIEAETNLLNAQALEILEEGEAEEWFGRLLELPRFPEPPPQVPSS